MGMTLYPFDNSGADTLLRHADQAMYKAKEEGKNRFHLFDINNDRLAKTKNELFSSLEKAIEKEELVLHYQPKVNLRREEVFGAEALIRWKHPDDGLVMPGQFLPYIEQHEIIIAIGNWTIRKALTDVTRWNREGLNLSVSINISARQLLQRDFVHSLRNIMIEFPEVRPNQLELEILESAALENTEHVTNVIQECRKLGVAFSLDDFGTGYASLSYLRDIPADILKIDRSFVMNVLNDRNDLTLIEGIIGLAKAFQRKIVAEGVETTEQGILLMRLGCDQAQGFGIAKPMPDAEMVKWVKNYKPDPRYSLWSNKHWEMNDLPLLVAQYDLDNWIKQILMCIENDHQVNFDAFFTDYKKCRFGKWFYNHGYRTYGQNRQFKQLEPLHIRIHKIGHQIIELCKVGKKDCLEEKVNDLLSLKEKILAKLDDLQKNVTVTTVH